MGVTIVEDSSYLNLVVHTIDFLKTSYTWNTELVKLPVIFPIKLLFLDENSILSSDTLY